MDLQEQFNQLDIQKSIAIGVGIALVYGVLLFDSGKKVDAAYRNTQNNISKSRKSLTEVEKALENQKRFEKEIAEISSNMKDFQRYFENEMTSNQLMTLVTQKAEERSIVLNSLRPVDGSNEFPNYPEVTIEFIVEGSFHNIMEFLGNLTDLGKPIDFKKMTFDTVVPGDFPVIKLTTTLVAYNRTVTAKK